MHEVELMMSLIVAATTFAGLTGVVIGQVRESNIPIKKKYRFTLLFIFLPMMFGILSTISVVIWFVTDSIYFSLSGIACFGIQLGSFWGLAASAWIYG